MAAEAGALQAQRKGQAFLQGISRANGWTDVEEKADEFFEYLTSKEECHNDISLLVQKALENIREYYDQGITLEEIAEKLNLPLGTVKSRIFFTRQKLQEELKDFR